MRILVTFAVGAEFAPWRKLRPFSKTNEKGRVQLFQGLLGGHEVAVLLTGIGRASVKTALQFYDSSHQTRPDVVISSGMAGALSGQLRPGDIVAPRTTRTLKNDVRAESEQRFLEIAAQKGATILETMITSMALVTTAEEKTRLAFFGQAVEMESALILSHFAESHAHLASIRAISDVADEDLPIDFDRCLTPQGAIKPLSLLNQLVRRPTLLPRLVEFGKQSHTAAQNLATFLDSFLGAIPLVPETVAVA
jgi:nucleoside phosphorylase